MNENNLNERRAEFIYNAARLATIGANAPIIPVEWSEREEPFKKQFLEVIEKQCGPNRSRSPEELHGTWMEAYFLMGWKYGEIYSRENKIHPDLVPYNKLGQLERDKDAVFVALCEIARQWIYNYAPAQPGPSIACVKCGGLDGTHTKRGCTGLPWTEAIQGKGKTDE